MQLVLTPAVQAAQERYFGKHQSVEDAPERDAFTGNEAAFIATRDSFYMATTNSDGWPYLQHRGGPAGFLKVLGPHQLGFADFKGNRQLISTGNLDGNDRVALFLMDYPNRRRLKILGHARVLDSREGPEAEIEEHLLAIPLANSKRSYTASRSARAMPWRWNGMRAR